MAETYQILLIEQDKQVADEIRRYLRASVGRADFAVTLGEDIQTGKVQASAMVPDLVIIDAAFIDKGTVFTSLKQQLKAQHVPIVILSATNGQELRDKASTAGAVDYLLKNKLNYFYLPKVILSAIQAKDRMAEQYDATGYDISSPQLLNQVSDAILIVSPVGEVLYANNTAKRLLSDADAGNTLKRFMDVGNGTNKVFNATIELQGIKYELKIKSQEWEGTDAMLMLLQKEISQNHFSLQTKIALLSDLIHSCTLPFVILVNEQIVVANNSFISLVKTESQTVVGHSLIDFMTTDKSGTLYLSHPPKPILVKTINGANLTAPLVLLQKTIATGDDMLTVCSFVAPDVDERQLLSPHRLMEIASHDLREPIRTTVSYLQLLTDGMKKEGSSKKLMGYAETLTDEMNRAERMLADMKSLMSLGDKVIKPRKIVMLSMIQEVLKQLKPTIDLNDAMVNVSEMPELKADEDDIKRLLHHLLDNALKFHPKEKRPYVEILSRIDGKFWQFCVKDNGIGIDKKYHEVIFEPFRKLNRVDEYKGAGNGLCICKHIVESHGGRLWVESHEGFGSSFFFTLPNL